MNSSPIEISPSRLPPPKRQDQNGLVKRHLQTVVSIAHNWMRAALLPSKYWLFAVKRACEVKNILPTTHLPNKITTPHELLHGTKPEYRSYSLFSLPPTSNFHGKMVRKRINDIPSPSNASLWAHALNLMPSNSFIHPPNKSSHAETTTA